MKNCNVVLSGSGVKFPFFLGALKAIESFNFNVNAIAGTSGGSIIASTYAFTKNTNDIISIVKSLTIQNFIKFNWKFLKDYSLYRLDEKKFREVITSITGSDRIENSKIPLKIVTTNLSFNKIVIASYGDLIDWIIASISVPGIFPAKEIGNSKYVDGGVCKNLLADAWVDRDDEITFLIYFKYGRNNPSSFIKYLTSLINTTLACNSRDEILDVYRMKKPHNVIVPIELDPDNYETLDFNLTKKDIDRMITLGFKQTYKILDLKFS